LNAFSSFFSLLGTLDSNGNPEQNMKLGLTAFSSANTTDKASVLGAFDLQQIPSSNTSVVEEKGAQNGNANKKPKDSSTDASEKKMEKDHEYPLPKRICKDKK